LRVTRAKKEHIPMSRVRMLSAPTRRQFLVVASAGVLHAPPPVTQPVVSEEAFRDIDSFCRRYLATAPKSLDPSLVKQTPL
jgi:hypothetical protein